MSEKVIKPHYLRLLTLFFAIFVLLTSKTVVHATNEYILVGDSRFKSMKSVLGVDNAQVIVDDNANLDWVKRKDLEKYVKDGTSLVINLGINDLENVDDYVTFFNSLQSECIDGAKIYIVSVNPVDETKAAENGKDIKNEDINNFNTKIKEGCPGCIFIDTNSELTNDGFETSDGVKYNDDTSKKVWDKIKGSVDGELAIETPRAYDSDENAKVPRYKTPNGNTLENLYSLTAQDLAKPIRWMAFRKNFVVLERNADKDQYWINTPNLQSLVTGKVDGVLSTGYSGNGIDVDKTTKDTIFKTDFDEGKTALKKFGFNIPNPTYKGEYPIITYSISSVLPKGVWGKIKSAIKGLFGGSFIDPPESAEDFESLEYVNVHDYKEDYAMCKWIYMHWNDTCKNLKDNDKGGQVLLPKSITGNKKGNIDGQDYTFQTCILDKKLEKVKGTPEQFNRKLKITFGQYYRPIMNCLIALEPGAEGSVLTNYTLRNMPYTTDGLRTSGGVSVSLVNDPRADTEAYYDLLHAKEKNSLKHKTKSGIVNLMGNLSKLSWALDQLTDFSLLESFGFKLDFFISSPLMMVLCYIFAISCLCWTVSYAIKIFRGSKGVVEGILKICAMLFSALFLFATAYNPKAVGDTFKAFADGPKAAFGNISSDKYEDYVASDASSKDIYEMAYWIPYFEIWTKYNTNHSLEECKVDQTNFENEPEQDEIEFAKIGTENSYLWNVLLADAFCDGYAVKSSAYRVVDHFLAPRVTIDFDHSKISSVSNENYNGDIQEEVGSTWFIVLDIFIAEIVKLIFFYNMVFEFMFLYMFIVFRYREEGAKKVFVSFFYSILFYWITAAVIPVVSSFTFACKGEFVKCFITSVVFAGAYFAFFKYLLNAPKVVKPKILYFIQNKGRR